MESLAEQTFPTDVTGQVFRLTPTNLCLGAGATTNPMIGPWRLYAPVPMTSLTAVAEVGIEKRNTPNGSAPTSKRKPISGRKG